MQTNSTNGAVAAVKDEHQRPVPFAWRPVIMRIVDALVRHDYQLVAGIPGVAPVSTATASQIQEYIEHYGETLMALPDATWKTSVCMWTGHHWDVLVDLWTIGEGSSDLVLGLEVLESGGSYIIDIHMVYVP
jgi:hypothetical protein